jgi:hypothetical protein
MRTEILINRWFNSPILWVGIVQRRRYAKISYAEGIPLGKSPLEKRGAGVGNNK